MATLARCLSNPYSVRLADIIDLACTSSRRLRTDGLGRSPARGRAQARALLDLRSDDAGGVDPSSERVSPSIAFRALPSVERVEIALDWLSGGERRRLSSPLAPTHALSRRSVTPHRLTSPPG